MQFFELQLLSTLKKPYMRPIEFAKTNGQCVMAGKVMGQEIMDDKSEVIEMTADIVSAYVGNNSVSTADLPALIQSVHRALAGISGGPEVVEPAPKEPAVPLKKSITPDFLICLEDGRKFKSLKRHLRTKYNMSPD